MSVSCRSCCVETFSCIAFTSLDLHSLAKWPLFVHLLQILSHAGTARWFGDNALPHLKQALFCESLSVLILDVIPPRLRPPCG